MTTYEEPPPLPVTDPSDRRFELVMRDEDYVCELDEGSVTKARKELGEDPRDRLKAVEALRDWIQAQGHLRSRIDTTFLLRYLRGAKYSQLRAREMIEGLLTIKTKYPQWFYNIDTRDEGLLTIVRNGYLLPLPGRLEDGSRVMIIRPGANDPNSKEFTIVDVIHCHMAVGLYLTFDEVTQINGAQFIVDMTRTSIKHMTKFAMDDIRKWHKGWQNTVAGRFKHFHFVNAGLLIEFLFNLAKPLLSKKFMERIKMHHGVESIYEYVPRELLPIDYLPDDYDGPSPGTIKDITDKLVEDLTQPAFRDMFLYESSEYFGVEESKRPPLKRDDSTTTFFRKLTVD